MNSERPSTWATLKAYWRAGLHTIHEFLENPMRNTVVSRDEPGTLNSPTPQMVTQDIQGHRSYDDMRMEAGHRARPEPTMERDRD